MKFKATTIAEYLSQLPTERRPLLEAVVQVIRDHLPTGYEEGICYGMIDFHVPLSVYPETYNQKPFSYVALASQKNHCALYLMCAYQSPELRKKLEDGFLQAGKKLEMGKSCLRFRTLEDLPLEVIGKIVAAVPMKELIAAARAKSRKTI